MNTNSINKFTIHGLMDHLKFTCKKLYKPNFIAQLYQRNKNEIKLVGDQMVKLNLNPCKLPQPFPSPKIHLCNKTNP